ncbi:MAG: hypothetical protein MZV65_28920 [Chromatiales bacterium]|nr:hypothetical protein [Chromatiales bacterium]
MWRWRGFTPDRGPQIGHSALLFNTDCRPTDGEDSLGLIVQPLMLRSGEGLTVEFDGSRQMYRVAKLLETTREFSLFEIVGHGCGRRLTATI